MTSNKTATCTDISNKIFCVQSLVLTWSVRESCVSSHVGILELAGLRLCRKILSTGAPLQLTMLHCWLTEVCGATHWELGTMANIPPPPPPPPPSHIHHSQIYLRQSQSWGKTSPTILGAHSITWLWHCTQ